MCAVNLGMSRAREQEKKPTKFWEDGGEPSKVDVLPASRGACYSGPVRCCPQSTERDNQREGITYVI